MPKLVKHCKFCNKPASVVSEERSESFKMLFTTFDCGHTEAAGLISVRNASEGMKLVCKTCLVERTDEVDFSPHLEHELVEIPQSRSVQFARAMNYQQAGVEFLERSNFNCALNDEQGLGKTIQALLAIKDNKEKLTPVLFVVKSKLKLNWAQEMLVNGWLCDSKDFTDYPFIVVDGQMAIIPGFRYYIVSMNMLEKSKSALKTLGFKLLVVDESQNFINTKSQRTKALLEIAEGIPHRVCMSGTPVLNRASEYWPTLNLVRPDHWLNYESFLRSWCDSELTESGGRRYTGLKPSMRDWFFKKTKDYILRRRKRDVLKDLPPFSRHFEVMDISGTPFGRLLNQEAEKLDNYLSSEAYEHAKGFERSSTILGYLMRMRHLTGLAKTPQLIEDIVEFLSETEDKTEKLLVGVHHDDVLDQLKIALKAWEPVIIGSGLSDQETMEAITEFRKPGRRLAIAKILASGEGLNLQFCNNMIVFERQWNPGKEGQFEARIDRPMKCAQCERLMERSEETLTCPKCGRSETVVPKTATYKIAKSTVDEVFTQMVEEKRKHCGETIDEDFDFEVDGTLLLMLGEKVARLRV